MAKLLKSRSTGSALILAALFSTAGIAANAAASGDAGLRHAVPTVYQDEYVTIRAGISETGTQPIHLGDALTLIIDIAFDARQVQVENLSEDVFQRAFAGIPSVRLYRPAQIETQSEAADRVRVTGRWLMQILDCPDTTASCPGNKAYELPVMTLSYQLTGSEGTAGDSRSARFRPWPGSINLAASIAAELSPGTQIADVLPGGAYAQPLSIPNVTSASSLLLVAGALLLATGYLASLQKHHPAHVTARPHAASTRWEHALVGLRDESLRDDEWSDRLRRCLTWYCVDELGYNPYAWLGAAASDSAAGDQSQAQWREFFIDVLQQHGIEPARRDEYLDRLMQLTGQVRIIDQPGQPA
jgi:hypothetical protein